MLKEYLSDITEDEIISILTRRLRYQMDYAESAITQIRIKLNQWEEQECSADDLKKMTNVYSTVISAFASALVDQDGEMQKLITLALKLDGEAQQLFKSIEQSNKSNTVELDLS